MPLQIVQYGEKVLHQAGEPITEFDQELRTLFQDMVDAMHEAEGIGLAAQQVGLAKQFCVVDLTGCDPDFEYTLDGTKPPLELFMPMGMCNPKVETMKSEPLVYEEGCLSFPNIRGDVERIESIRCEYQDIEGNPHVIEADGLLGRCIQHEVDHLNGTLFTDRMKKKVYKKIQLPVNALKAKTLQRLKRRGA
jgi:peptide deformylase